MPTAVCPQRCDVDLETADQGFNEGSLLDDLGRFRGASSFTGMHRTYAGASVLVATKPAELAPGLRLLEVPATCRSPLNNIVWLCVPCTRHSFAADAHKSCCPDRQPACASLLLTAPQTKQKAGVLQAL